MSGELGAAAHKWRCCTFCLHDMAPVREHRDMRGPTRLSGVPSVSVWPQRPSKLKLKLKLSFLNARN